MKKLYFFASFIATMLMSACGGGDSNSNSLDVYNVPSSAPTISHYYRMDTNTGVTGSIAALSIFKDSGCFNCNVTLLFTVENFNTDNPVFIGSSGIVKSAKNAIGFCSKGEQPNLSSVASTNSTYQKGLIPLISADGFPATVSDIKNSTFTGFDCAGTHLKYTFNADGTATVVDNISTLVLTAEQVQTLFTKGAGITLNGHTYVSSIHKFYSKNSVIGYAMVIYVDWNTPSGYMQLFY